MIPLSNSHWLTQYEVIALRGQPGCRWTGRSAQTCRLNGSKTAARAPASGFNSGRASIWGLVGFARCRHDDQSHCGYSSNRALTAPLYLTLDCLTDSNLAHFLPATYPPNDARNAVVSNGRIDISHALNNAGTLEEAGKRRTFDYTLIEGDTHWPEGKVLTFGLAHRSLEHAGQYGPITALDSTTWDRSCRLVVTLEASGGQQSAVIVPTTQVPLFSGDGGSGAEPTITAASFDQPTELGGADTHQTAFLFASTAGDSKNIRPHHLGPFTCAAGRELMLFNVYQGTTIQTHRTGLTSIANVDAYLRALSPDYAKGYGSIYYANSGGVTFSQHTNRYYVIAVTPLSGGGGGQ